MNAYFRKMGIDPRRKSDKAKLTEAYNKAHDIRKFEIEMYWKRSAYLWTIQAAALAGFALVGSRINLENFNLDQDSDNLSSSILQCIVIFSICTFGMFSAYVWVLLLKGSKHWQSNWERHLDLLEDHVSGALYKTYPLNHTRSPYSVSKLNELMALFTLAMWLIIAGTVSILLFPLKIILGCAITLLLVVILLRAFNSKLKMTDFPKETDSEILPQPSSMIVLKRPAPKFPP